MAKKQQKKPFIMSFATCKGGTAKTMSAVSTAAILAEQGFRVLLFDNDPQANATNNLGIEELNADIPTVELVYEDMAFDISKVIRKAPVSGLPNLDIVPGSIGLTATELRISSLAGRENILRHCFRRNDAVISQYDYVIFDTNPYFTICNICAFVVSDAIVLTTGCGMNDLKGVNLFRALWQDLRERLDMSDNVLGVLVTRFDKRVGLQKDFVEYMLSDEEYRELSFQTVIPNNSRLSETEVRFTPINLHDKSSAGYLAYRAFADELKARIELSLKK